MGKRAFAKEAFLAGLIHDLGLLVERQAYPDGLAEVIRKSTKGGRRFHELEQEIVGSDHQEMGSALAAKWKFPRGLQNVLGYHHSIDNLHAEHRLLPVMVYVADTLCSQERYGFHLTAENQLADEALLTSVGLTEAGYDQARTELAEQVEACEAILTG